MTEKDLFREIKDGYAVCFLDGCPSSETCMRRIVYKRMPPDKNSGNSVMPKVLEADSCPMYVEFKIVRKAWGFRKMYDRVAKGDLYRMKAKITAYLHGHNTYYRYYRGEKLLTEEQQKWIEDYFKANGYDAEDLFDGYVETYNS